MKSALPHMTDSDSCSASEETQQKKSSAPKDPGYDNSYLNKRAHALNPFTSVTGKAEWKVLIILCGMNEMHCTISTFCAPA